MLSAYRKTIAIVVSVLCLLILALPQPALGQWYKVDISSYDAFRAETMENAYICDDGDSAQCWDGACLLWQQLGRLLLTGDRGFASECWTNESSRSTNAGTEFTLITNFVDVRRGDVVVMAAEPGNDPGHICFADENYNGTGTMAIYGQNQRGTNGNHAFTVINKPNMDQLFLGAFRYKPWHDMQPPVISKWTDLTYTVGQIQMTFAVTDNEAVNPGSVKVYAYEFGQEGQRSEQHVEPAGNDITSATKLQHGHALM